MFQAVVLEQIKTRILCSVTFFFFENRAIYEIMWKNIVEPDRLQMTIWLTRIACWIPMATNTLSQYVILIAFLLQQWLLAITSMFIICTLPVLFLSVCDNYLSYQFVLLLINVFLLSYLHRPPPKCC